MERKENLCQPPEYQAEIFSEYFESAKKRALRASEIEAILGADYDLDRLRELVEADRDGRCVVLPISTPSMAYTVDPKGGYISIGFYRTPGAVLHDIERGYVIVKTREEAEATRRTEWLSASKESLRRMSSEKQCRGLKRQTEEGSEIMK